MSNTYDFSGTKIIKQTEDREVTLKITNSDGSPYDLSEYDVIMQVRSNTNSNTVLDELTIENDRVLIETYEVEEETFYQIKLLFPSTITKKYNFVNAVYDLFIISDGDVKKRLIEGVFLVSPSVTKVE